MSRTASCLLALSCLAALAVPAYAQVTVDPSINPGRFKHDTSTLPAVQAPREVWPRLDPGAVLCQTEADLDRLARRRAGDAVDGPVDCRIIQSATPITIVQRKGPRTEVKVTAGKAAGTGWTDVWLPQKAPGG